MTALASGAGASAALGAAASAGTHDGAGPAAGAVPPEAFATAMAGLPKMGPRRLAAILATVPPEAAWQRIRAGRVWTDPAVRQALGPSAADLVDTWRRAAADVDPVDSWQGVVRAGIAVSLHGSPTYPPALANDVEPPAVLFQRGDPGVIDRPRVAIVGTRRCSTTGSGMAFELGRDLAAVGVGVVSGLASGIDGAAHRGALACDGGAPPIGVVGSGLDVVYPPGQGRLWRAVAEAGVLLSEAPLGARPERWRFPARNRIIAALADLVVVVESHRRGGSLHTVDEADRRGIDVFVVPGSVRNPAAAGTNELLAEGRPPVCSVDDLLVALDLQATPRVAGTDRRPPPDHADRPVLEAVGWQPSTLDQVVLRTGLGLALLAPALERLCEAGWVARNGGWYERVAATGESR
jgi:DNA processing protein